MKASMKLLWATLACMLLLSSKVALADGVEDVDDDDEYEDVVRAHLIVRKSAKPEQLVVQGRNVTVTIDIYNSGAGTAKNVRIMDLLASGAKVLSGSMDTTIPSIASGSTAQHSYTITFTNGGTSTVLMPATVKYIDEEGSEQTGTSSFEHLYVMTPVQHITRYAVIAGSYVSLGFCRSVTDWRNLGIVVGLVGAVVGGSSMMNSMSTAKTTRQRRAALRELGQDH